MAPNTWLSSSSMNTGWSMLRTTTLTWVKLALTERPVRMSNCAVRPLPCQVGTGAAASRAVGGEVLVMGFLRSRRPVAHGTVPRADRRT
ncbi:hypothetical protein SVIOM342S_03563 [Streptomyces violaceorubidus]